MIPEPPPGAAWTMVESDGTSYLLTSSLTLLQKGVCFQKNPLIACTEGLEAGSTQEQALLPANSIPKIEKLLCTCPASSSCCTAPESVGCDHPPGSSMMLCLTTKPVMHLR